MARLFSYICVNYFAGRTDQLSEVKIAMEVFGRSETFDRNQDAIARVEAHRLRKKLKRYYEAEGKYHELQIELPTGSYVPVFRHVPAVLSPEQQGAPVAEVLPIELPVGRAHADPVAASPRRGYTVWYVAAGVAAVLVLFGLARTLTRKSTGERGVSSNQPVAASLMATGASGESAIRFLCGYSGPTHIGRLGELWGADKYYKGGGPWATRRGYIRRANDPFLFQNTRTGTFSYDIPVSPGNYELHLYFIETEYGEELGGGENTRTMVIRLNGATLFQSFDPLADAGGPRIADERVFKDIQAAADGQVHLRFESQRGQPLICAIELMPGTPHRQLPIRLVTQVNSYTDHAGQVWAPDNYYLGGQFFTDKPAVSGTRDPMMFTSERAGNFSYAIPVDVNGTYGAKLYFAETYFGPEASGIGGVGSRVFNVTSDGVTLLNHFDIFKEAGSLRAVEKSFHGLKPNPAGKLILSFEPVANYASVFAIEVVDETR